MGQERRRRLLVATGALFVAPRLALAQQIAKVWRIGYIGPSGPTEFTDEFRKGMRDLGYLEGKNVLIEWRFAHGDFAKLPAQAAELVRMKVDVIVVGGTPAAEAVKRTTTTIPVVMATVGDPVASGFVTSLARPGGNITGLSLANTDLPTKWFEMAKSVSPESRVGVLANPKQQTAQWYVKDIQGVAHKMGIKVSVAYAATADEIEGAFNLLNGEKVTTVIVLPTGLFFTNAQQIAQLAVKHRMASIGTTTGDADRGLLLSYGQNYGAFNRKAAVYVDKIFKGAKPSDLPIEQPTTLELTINLRTARQIGLSTPRELLLRADRIIE